MISLGVAKPVHDQVKCMYLVNHHDKAYYCLCLERGLLLSSLKLWYCILLYYVNLLGLASSSFMHVSFPYVIVGKFIWNMLSYCPGFSFLYSPYQAKWLVESGLVPLRLFQERCEVTCDFSLKCSWFLSYYNLLLELFYFHIGTGKWK